jgi:dihydrofolate reductase
MRRLVLQMQVSVDGFVGGPNGELDWIFASTSDDATAWIVDHLWQAGVHIMGSRTYQDMAAHWPTSTEPYAAPMNEIPKVVFSTRAKGLLEPEWAPSRLARAPLAEEVARLKQQSGKEILAHGGAGFARSLVRLKLVDEFRLLVHPVALGRGLSLFSEVAKPLDLSLVSATSFESGTVAHIYRPA